MDIEELSKMVKDNELIIYSSSDLHIVRAIWECLQKHDANDRLGSTIREISFHPKLMSPGLTQFYKDPETLAAIVSHCKNLERVFIFDRVIKHRCVLDALATCAKLQNMSWRVDKGAEFQETDMIQYHICWKDMRSVVLFSVNNRRITADTVRAIINESPRLEKLCIVHADFDKECLNALPDTMKILVLSTAETMNIPVDDGDSDKVVLSGTAIVEVLQRIPDMKMYAETDQQLETHDVQILERFKTAKYSVVRAAGDFD
jgi:hypothetical protein